MAAGLYVNLYFRRTPLVSVWGTGAEQRREGLEGRLLKGGVDRTW